jgi:hypothetical protein
VLKLGAVLGTLGHMTGLTEQLALRGFFNESVPRSGQRSADGKDLGRRIDVIELKVLRGAAAYALATKHLDKSIAPGSLPNFVVVALICCSILDHLRLPQPLTQLFFYVLRLARLSHSISLVNKFEK